MKNYKIVFTLLLVFFCASLNTRLNAQDQINTHSYAYIVINGKIFSKKLRVTVDLGDSPEQIKKGKEFSVLLSNKTSIAAVLNYMVKKEFELIQTIDYTDTYDGTGGTSGIVFIMRKME